MTANSNPEAPAAPVVELHRDAICKLTKGDGPDGVEWVTCGESVVAEYLAADYRWDYQATAEARSLSLALWTYWHDQQKARADKAEAAAPDMLAALKGIRAHRPDHADNAWDAVDEAIAKAVQS